MKDPNYGLELKDVKTGFFTSKKCMTGVHLIDWLLAQKYAEPGQRGDAAVIASMLISRGVIEVRFLYSYGAYRQRSDTCCCSWQRPSTTRRRTVGSTTR